MNLNSKYFKAFPDYEEVFYDDIENHKKYFLPICSVNLKCVDPNRDEWVHFISTLEIFRNPLGEETQEFHTSFTKEDMFSFDIIEGKYKFDSSWNYFLLNHKEEKEVEKSLIRYFDENRYNFKDITEFNHWINGKSNNAQLKKELTKLYQWHDNEKKKDAYQHAIIRIENNLRLDYINDLQEIYDQNRKHFNHVKDKFHDHPIIDENAEFFNFINDLKFQSKEAQIDVEEQEFTMEILHEKADDERSNMFEYIGYLTGFNFQKYGADELYLFQSKELNKATIVLHYS